MIPISDLMQITHPGYAVFRLGDDIEEEHFPLFLDYCLCVCERFRHYAEEYSERLVTENSLVQIMDCIHELNRTDEPEEVFPLRYKLKVSCDNFASYCNDMGKCFDRPPSMVRFYSDIGKMVDMVVCDYAGVED